jgi:hypothetical protein
VQEQASNFRFGPILRDVAILWVLTGMGGFVAGFATQGIARSSAAAIANLFFGTVGFTISGCLAAAPRWQHLVNVALFTWFTSLINVFFGLPLEQWLWGMFFFPLVMAIGGGLSYLFKRSP